MAVEARMSKLEGIMEEIRTRLNNVEARIETKAEKWEIRIWFLIIIAFMTALKFL